MKKLLPYSLVCVEEIEKWLNEMALEGHHLVKMNKYIATFEDGTPADVKYSFVVELCDIDENNCDEEISDLNIHKDSGWEAVQKRITHRVHDNSWNTLRVSYVLYKSIDDVPLKDIKKTESQSQTLVKAANRKSLDMINLAFFILGISTFFSSMAFINIYYHSFIDQFYYYMTCVITFYVLVAFFLFKSIRLFLLKRYYKGKRRALKKPVKQHLVFIAFWVAICGIVTLYYGTDPERFSDKKDGVYMGDIENLVTMEELEGEYGTYLPDYVSDDYYYGYRSSALFMPLRYLLEEKTTTNENQGSEVSLTVIYTKSYLQWHLKTAYNYNIFHRAKSETRTSSQQFDEIKYYEYEKEKGDKNIYTQYAFMFHNKNELIEIWYRGNRTPEEIIANVERLFSGE